MSDTPRDPTVLWWGRFDPDYSRNRIVRQCFTELGWEVADFRPRVSALGRWEARWQKTRASDLLWVPCFRQRDMAAAHQWAHRHGVPLVFDPLISAYDKQVFERRKFTAASGAAQRLLRWEQLLFGQADLVVADTASHAAFFRDTLGVPDSRLAVIPVGAEETLFQPQPLSLPARGTPLEVLFFGSFIALQGVETIVAAARRYAGPPVRWILVGNGPLRASCQRAAAGLTCVHFEDWLPYARLPPRIHRAHLCLGVFGTSDKAARVIPNKVYQALAGGRPVITRRGPAYPESLSADGGSGLFQVPPGDPAALAAAVATLAAQPEQLVEAGVQARLTYERFFSHTAVRAAVAAALARLTPAHG
ncbi:MAG TPA: glycosyltransferase [Gammaproteobacteria bacterium]|nr:glycosyltransferase [Gammaproteobacteria bacterium]